jgi:hypothetical protein
MSKTVYAIEFEGGSQHPHRPAPKFVCSTLDHAIEIAKLQCVFEGEAPRPVRHMKDGSYYYTIGDVAIWEVQLDPHPIEAVNSIKLHRRWNRWFSWSVHYCLPDAQNAFVAQTDGREYRTPERAKQAGMDYLFHLAVTACLESNSQYRVKSTYDGFELDPSYTSSTDENTGGGE